MQKEENKFADSCVFEGMVSIRAILSSRAFGISDRKIEKIIYTAKHAKKNPKELAFLRHEAERSHFSLEETDEEYLERITCGNTHGGIVAICSPRTYPPLTASAIADNGFYCMMEGIEDPYNFGYALRSLYAMGCHGIVVPERNWLSCAGTVCRSSAGASELFPIYMAKAEDAADLFKQAGYQIVCADVATDTSLSNASLSYPLFLIVGGEKRGISRAVLNKADTVVKIDYGRPFDNALSAASATTILAYEIARQNMKK